MCVIAFVSTIIFNTGISISATFFEPYITNEKVHCVALQCLNEPPNDKTNKMACAPSEDSDQPGHPPSLIRVFAVHLKKLGLLAYPLMPRLI